MTELPEVKTLTYEQARQELDEIVNVLERGNLQLEEVLIKWERGEELIEHCRAYLNGARSRIDQRVQKSNQLKQEEQTPF